MPASKPSISGTLTAVNSVPTSYNNSTVITKGGPVFPLNSVGVTSWIPVGVSEVDEEIIYKELAVYPEFEGQLFWSSTVGTIDNFNITPNSASLYVAVPLDLLPVENPDLVLNTLVWVPVLLDVAASYIDPATGKTWDPMGAVTCNPPFLCAS